MRKFVIGFLALSTAALAVVNPNNPEAEKTIDSFREVLPSPDIRHITLSEVQVINTKGNFWTVVVLPFENFEYLVGNSNYYEVRKEKNKLIIRPKKQYVNSDITVIRNGEVYKFLLSQSRQLPDLVVRVSLPQVVDYEKEVEAFLKGVPAPELKHIRVEPFQEGKEYDRVVYYDGKKWGIRYVR
ncbi:hypothetical protein [Persephonella sp.]